MTDVLQTFAKIEQLLARHHGDVDVAGSKPDALIDKAEAHLGVRLPPSYREFLRRYGTLGFGPEEIYGIVSDDFDEPGIPDGIWFTTVERRDSRLPKNLVVVVNLDGEEYLCLDTADTNANGECPVVAWDVEARQVVGQKAPDFITFLLQRLTDTAELLASSSADLGESTP